MMVLFCVLPSFCVSFDLFLFPFFFSFSLLIFLSRPVLGQADQSGRFLPWSTSHLPVSRLMTNGSKINTFRKEIQLFIHSTPHTLLHMSALSLHTNTSACINTESDISTRTDKIFFKRTNTHQSPIPRSN